MSAIPIAGSLIVTALTNVIAGMIPVTFTGNAQLAVWLLSLLFGVVAYVSLTQALNK